MKKYKQFGLISLKQQDPNLGTFYIKLVRKYGQKPNPRLSNVSRFYRIATTMLEEFWNYKKTYEKV